MTKEEFEALQLDLQQSGQPLMSYLKEAGVKYSTYTYWRRKADAGKKSQPSIAPICFTPHTDPVFFGSIPTGATLLFPNGLRARRSSIMSEPSIRQSIWDWI